MLKEYEVRPIDPEDFEQRELLLTTHKYTVIFEGDFLEFDNAESWVKKELDLATINFIFYGKLDYDYGFFEFFFSNEADAKRFSDKVPDIYTRYPNGSVSKTKGSSTDFKQPPLL